MSVTIDEDLWSAVGDPTRRRMLDLLLTAGVGTATSPRGARSATGSTTLNSGAPVEGP